MDKRMVWSAAGAITITVVAASSAIAVSMNGTPDRSAGDPGTFSPSAVTASTTGAAPAGSVEPQVITVYVDETTTTVAPSAAARSTIGSTVPAPPTAVVSSTVATIAPPAVTTSGGSGTGSSDDDRDEDHDDEREREHEEKHDYEGGEDDD